MFTIGSRLVFSLARWSARIRTPFHVWCATQDPRSCPLRFRLRGSHALWPAFPSRSAICKVAIIPGPSTPQEYLRFGLYRFRSPLLTVSISLSFPPLTEMFHFSGSRDRNPMSSGYVNSPFRLLGYPIRTPPVLSSLAAPRGFSQLAASFFAYRLQGILHKPFSLSSLFSKGPSSSLSPVFCAVG